MGVLGDTVPRRDNKVEWKKIRDNIAMNLTRPMEKRIDSLIEVLRHTTPSRDNKEEWQEIRDSCDSIRKDPQLNSRIHRLVYTLSKIKPRRDNMEEWERIRKTCHRFLDSI